MLRRRAALFFGLVSIALAAATATARQQGMERLPADVLDVVPPSARVRGAPGEMTVQPRPCRTLPTADTRRRIVDVAVQEWGFFGFRIVARPTRTRAGTTMARDRSSRAGGRSRLPPRKRRASRPRSPGTGP